MPQLQAHGKVKYNAVKRSTRCNLGLNYNTLTIDACRQMVCHYNQFSEIFLFLFNAEEVGLN
jgi:hypothetical protein